MIEIRQHGAVTRFRLGREVMGKALYWTSCFWLDGLLIDTGCAPHRQRVAGGVKSAFRRNLS